MLSRSPRLFLKGVLAYVNMIYYHMLAIRPRPFGCSTPRGLNSDACVLAVMDWNVCGMVMRYCHEIAPLSSHLHSVH